MLCRVAVPLGSWTLLCTGGHVSPPEWVERTGGCRVELSFTFLAADLALRMVENADTRCFRDPAFRAINASCPLSQTNVTLGEHETEVISDNIGPS